MYHISIKDGSGNDVTTVTTSVGYKNPYRDRGYRYDTETGLYYLQSRYYNPDWGRFLNADSLAGQVGVLLSHNMFAYCGNNPVNMVDPSGEYSIAIPWGGIFSGAEKVATGVASKVLGVVGAIGSIFWDAKPTSDEGWANVRGLHPDGVTPPGYGSDWKIGDASRPSEAEKGGKSTYDPSGSEWKYSPDDKYHHPHWDYNPHSAPNSPWENVPLNPGDELYK